MADLTLVELAGMILGPSGGAFLAVKQAFNGVVTDITEIKGDVKALGSKLEKQTIRQVRLESRQGVVEDAVDDLKERAG